MAGGRFQTVWNDLSGQNATAGIRDYDVFNHDAADTSWQAEDAVIRHSAKILGDLDIDVQIRNQAHGHLGWPQKCGIA
ncbi:nucleotidyltransferase family protein [Salinisphaera sp. SPP-AMP-43]|uniref:nucleotidyltransferase family protein n=1 Tax=Salinisphaera sp. SPP-AMP-43 TaxID=3121288 RepID=UPI003C6E2D68